MQFPLLDNPRPTKIDRPLQLAMLAQKYRHWILLFWFLLLAVSAPFAPNLLKDTELAFTPPLHSPANVATLAFQKQFPIQSNLTNLVILASSTNHSDIRDYTELARFSHRLNHSLRTDARTKHVVFDYQSYFSLVEQQIPLELANEFLSNNKTTGHVSNHPDSTIFILVVRGEETSRGLILFSEHVRNIMDDDLGRGALEQKEGLKLTLTGLPALYDGIMASAIHDLETMDSMVLPIAMAILGLLVASFRLLLIPLAALGVSAALSFATVDGLTKCGIPILTAAPSLMASVFIAMSIDYSMFLLTRFQEEKMVLAQCTKQGKVYFGSKPLSDKNKNKTSTPVTFSKELIPVMAIVLGSSGKIIVASGSTLVICFAGLLAIPMNLMQSIGLSCAVSLMYTMAVNLTLCPALIFTFPTFFTNTCLPQCGGGSSGSSTAAPTRRSPFGSFATAALSTPSSSSLTAATTTTTTTNGVPLESVIIDEQPQQYGTCNVSGGLNAPMLSSSFSNTPVSTRTRSSSSILSVDLSPVQQVQLQQTCWYKIALFTQSYFGSCFVIALTALVVVPLGFNAFDGELSATMDAYLPRHGDGLHAISVIEQNFASGTTYPYRLFINVGNHDSSVTSVLNKTFVDSVQLFLHELTNEPDTTKGGLPNGTIVTSYMWSTDLPKDLGGPSIDYFFINAALSGTLGPRKNTNTGSNTVLCVGNWAQ